MIPAIVDPQLQFVRPLYVRPFTRRIVVHHGACGLNVDAATIHGWHIARGWSGIGYHYVIHYDGTIEIGRPENMQGAHAYQDTAHEANTDGIGICLIGDFTKAPPSEAQIESLVWLVGDIRTRWPNQLPLIGHNQVQATACPGPLFPMARVQEMLQGGGYEMDWIKQNWEAAIGCRLIDPTKHQPGEPVTLITVLAIVLNAIRYIKGGTL